MPPRSLMAWSMPGLSPILAEAERRGEPGAAAWRCRPAQPGVTV